MELTTTVLPIITLIMNAAFTNIVLCQKRRPLVTFLVWFCSSSAICFCAYFLMVDFPQRHIVQLIAGLLCIFICMYLYKNSVIQIIFIFFSIWVVSSMFSNLCLYVSKLYFGFLQIQYQGLLRILLFIVIYSLFIFYFNHKIVTTFTKIMTLLDTHWVTFIIFPIISFVSFNLFRIYSKNTITYYTFVAALSNIFIVVFTYYLIFSIANHILQKLHLEERLNTLNVHQSLQKERYFELKKKITEISRIHHDNHHHLLFIQNLLKMEKFIELDKYLSSLIFKEESIGLHVLCDNSSVNAIISYYIQRAESSKIKVDTKINIPENINIDSLDINVILGNCLENAIEACIKLTDESQRFIALKAAIVKNYFVLSITNSFNGVMNIQSDCICSTKPNSEYHGIGLESVRNIVNQYNGTMSVQYTQNEFIISIMMCNISV